MGERTTRQAAGDAGASSADDMQLQAIKNAKRKWSLAITRRILFLPNVPSDLSLLAFGIPPAREAESAGGMPKVPKGQGLGPLACSDLCLLDQ